MNILEVRRNLRHILEFFLVEHFDLICNFENFWSPFLAEIDKLMHRVDEIYVRIDSAFKSLQAEEKDK